ncbi:rhomboid-like protein [Streptomyces sp. NPDC007988]|uniref:rhomboid-like protein n=1 Tax=Streptomyces sp. NPDC007988 TaxID=3364802 RepID=UPI0036E98114
MAPGRGGAAGADERAPRRLPARPVRLVPDPRGTPFTFWYALVLLGTSVYARYGDPATVSALLRGSSTDAAHLATVPLLVLVASALWIAGGLASPYALGFVLVLTALERRVGGLRAAAVFLGGHVAATLATEIPVGLWVMAGRLPETSLHRLDYGISFGLLACVGALTVLFRPLPAAVVLAGVSALLVLDLLAYEDPLSNWGHPVALLSGLASGPLVRRRQRYRELRRRQEREGMRETSEERDVREGRRMPTGQRMSEGPE